MDSRGKRWCISEICIFKIIELCSHVDAHDRDVNHLVHLARSKHLDTEQFPRCPIGDQLCDKE